MTSVLAAVNWSYVVAGVVSTVVGFGLALVMLWGVVRDGRRRR